MSSLLQSLSNSSAAFNHYLIWLPCCSYERMYQRSHSWCGPKILTYCIKDRRRFRRGLKSVNLPNALQGALLYKLPCENLFKNFNKFLLWRCFLQQQRDSPFQWLSLVIRILILSTAVRCFYFFSKWNSGSHLIKLSRFLYSIFFFLNEGKNFGNNFKEPFQQLYFSLIDFFLF